MSFVLSGTEWKDSYNDLSDSDSEELKEKVLAGVRTARRSLGNLLGFLFIILFSHKFTIFQVFDVKNRWGTSYGKLA